MEEYQRDCTNKVSKDNCEAKFRCHGVQLL